MAHDHGKNDHHHDHGDDHHHWESAEYVRSWIARDDSRLAERAPIIEKLIAAVPFGHDAAINVLDVGGGAGLMAAAVLDAFPRATVTLQDYSVPMLAQAKARLARH